MSQQDVESNKYLGRILEPDATTRLWDARTGKSVDHIALRQATLRSAMNDASLIDALKKDGLLTEEHLTRWRAAAGLMAALDAIGQQGAVALVKVDGARTDGAIYSVVVSGGSLNGDFFRKDGGDLHSLLREAIAYYQAQARSVSTG